MVIVDLKMPDMDGIEVMETIKKIDKHATVLVITGYGTIENAVETIKKGAYDLIPKPVGFGELEVIINRALERSTIFSQLHKFRRRSKQLTPVLSAGAAGLSGARHRLNGLGDKYLRRPVNYITAFE